MTAKTASDFVSRVPTPEDAQEIFNLIRAYDLALSKQPDMTIDSVISDWKEPGFDLARDARIITTRQGAIIGYEIILSVAEDGRIRTDGYVHPNYMNQGVATELLRWVEARAREHLRILPADARVRLLTGIYGDHAASLDLLQAEGYAAVRRFWRMIIDMVEPPPTAQWPDGITVRPFVIGQDEHAAWQALNEIFDEDWEYIRMPFEEWVAAKITREPFDPSLWHLAIADDEIAGMSRGMYKMDIGWIRSVGVRRRWRRQGLAMALLHHSFGEFYRRGKRSVGLGVDSENPTGATRLYERAGMHIAEIFDLCEKELRPGKSRL